MLLCCYWVTRRLAVYTLHGQENADFPADGFVSMCVTDY